MLIKAVLLVHFILVISLASAQVEEYKTHLNSMDSSNRDFANYSIKNLLVQPGDKKYISNRKLLYKLNSPVCDSIQTSISDTLKTGEKCLIVIRQKKFIPTQHEIELNSNGDFKKIDNLFPYGGQYGIPDIEINSLSIQINGRDLDIPKNAFRDLYKPHLCEDSFNQRIEAYTSLDGKFLYLYFFGGNAAGTYFAKLIFNKRKYLTRIIADYNSLSIHSSFGRTFIGY